MWALVSPEASAFPAGRVFPGFAIGRIPRSLVESLPSRVAASPGLSHLISQPCLEGAVSSFLI